MEERSDGAGGLSSISSPLTDIWVVPRPKPSVSRCDGFERSGENHVDSYNSRASCTQRCHSGQWMQLRGASMLNDSAIVRSYPVRDMINKHSEVKWCNLRVARRTQERRNKTRPCAFVIWRNKHQRSFWNSRRLHFSWKSFLFLLFLV